MRVAGVLYRTGNAGIPQISVLPLRTTKTMGKKTKKQITLLKERLQRLKKVAADLRQQGNNPLELEELQSQIVRAERELELAAHIYVQK